MSKNLKYQLQQMTNEELIDFALENLGQEHEAIRKAALQEHFLRLWHANLTQSAKRFKGYIRTDLYPPVKGLQLKWYSIVHFDSPDHLNLWLKSDDREKLIEAGQKIFESYQFK